jgi:hypothetical protein
VGHRSVRRHLERSHGPTFPFTGRPELALADVPAPQQREAPAGEPTSNEALFIIPCSGRKASGGETAGSGPSIIELLPSELARGLHEARARLAPTAGVDESRVLPASARYTGTLYTSAGKALGSDGVPTVILSGGYGLVLPNEPIGIYDRRFSTADWPPGLLEACLLALVRRLGVHHVLAFCARTTSYAELLRRVRWGRAGIEARLAAPLMGSRRGAQVLVPRAAGEAFAVASGGRLDRSWISSDGIPLSMEVLP